MYLTSLDILFCAATAQWQLTAPLLVLPHLEYIADKHSICRDLVCENEGRANQWEQGRRLMSLGLRGVVARMTVPGPFYVGILVFLVILGSDLTVRLHISCTWTGLSLTLLRQQQTRWTVKTSLAIDKICNFAWNPHFPAVLHTKVSINSMVSLLAHADQLDLVTPYVVTFTQEGVTYTPTAFNLCGNQFVDGSGVTWYVMGSKIYCKK